MNQHRIPTLVRVLALVASVFLSAGAAMAAISIGPKDRIQVGGFVSQGWLQSSGNNYPVEAKDGTFDFREAAVNVSTTFGSRLRVGAQAFAQTLGNYGEDKVRLDWAVADYSFRPEFGIRAGRVKFAKGLYGEALDVDAVRPFVFLPMSLYNPVVRDFNSAFDGAMFYGSIDARGAGSFDYKLFYGDISMNPDQGVADFFNTTSIYARSGVTSLGMEEVRGAQLFWNTPVAGLKVGYSYSAFGDLYATGPLAAAPVFPATLATDDFAYHTVSAEYLTGNWTFAAEYQTVGGDFVVRTPFSNSPSESKVVNWYASVARRFNDRFEAGAYYSVQENDNAAATVPKKNTYNRDWAVSLRFDVNQHIIIKAEHHWIDGRYNVFNTVRTPNASIKDSSSFFAVKTTLSF